MAECYYAGGDGWQEGGVCALPAPGHPVLASFAPAPGPQDSPQPLSRNGTETVFASVSPQEMGTGPLFPSDGQQMSQSPARLGGDRLAATNSSWLYKI